VVEAFGKNNKPLATMKIVSVGKIQSLKAVCLVSTSVLLKIAMGWKTNRNFYKLGIRTTASIQKVAFLSIKTLNTLENTVSFMRVDKIAYNLSLTSIKVLQ
jgi:hypothetical protein